MKKIKNFVTICLIVLLGLQLPTKASNLPDAETQYQIPNAQLFAFELVSGYMCGILGIVIAYSTTSYITGTNLKFMESGGMSTHRFGISILTGYTLGASFGTYISTKLNIPTASYKNHLLYSVSCTIIGTALGHSRQEELQNMGVALIAFGTVIVPSFYGLKEQIKYKKAYLSFQPFLYNKSIINGVGLNVLL